MQNNVEGYKFIFDLISEIAAAVSRVLGRHNSTLFRNDSSNHYIEKPENCEYRDDSNEE